MNNKLQPVIDPQLSTCSGIRHAFFTRKGGLSKGIYEGLNVGIGSDDDPQTVLKNRELVAQYFSLDLDRLATAYQIHSSDVIILDGPMPKERPEVDAIVTATPGLAIGVLTADCGPVLFCDDYAGVIGAAHSGWRGATASVLENTIKAMESLGAKRSNITATLGPLISQKNYEVGPQFIENLLNLDSANTAWLIPSANKDHAMFDLANYIVDRLTKSGVNASWTGQCTYENEDLFYSYRRKTHRNEPDFGRQLSAISLI